MGAYRLYKGSCPYPDSAVYELDHVQTADLLYTAHLDYNPYKLTRYDHTDWRWTTVVFGPVIDPPTGMGVVATTPNTTGYAEQTYKYKITAIKDTNPVQESRASEVISVNNDLSLSGNYNTITVPAPAGDVSRHVIYKEQAGAYGYIGATDGTSFKDQQIQPILSETPPTGDNPFAGTGNYPAAVGLHQQRLMYGATRNVINGVWGSRSADLENMDRSRPARSDDALSFALVSQKVNAVTYLASMKDGLQVLTTDAIFNVTGGDSKVMTPGDINPEKSSSRGARRVKPLPVDNVLMFVPSKGMMVRALGFSFEIDGYKSDNVSIFSPHLFRGYSILKLAHQEEPFSCIYAVRSDGVLLCLTWEIEQQVWGWSVLETDGVVEDIATISEGGYDRLYALIRRTISGKERLFIERMALPQMQDIATANHLDCSISQVFDPPRSVIRGLWHLEGQKVSASWDGYAVHDLTVKDGTITLPSAGTIVTVGLRFKGRLETLPSALTSSQGSLHVERQQIGDIVVRTIDTRGIQIGASGTGLLEQVEPLNGEDVGEFMDVDAVDYRVTPPGDWKDTSTIVIEQNEPLPAHVVGIFYKQLVNDD